MPEETDVAVIGGGYGGLNCGLELARRGVRVAVFEAGAFGEGASTRNGGFVSGGIGAGARHGQRSDAFVAEGAAAMAHVENVVVREGMDCFYRRDGRLIAAHSARAFDGLKRQAEAINKTAATPWRVVERACLDEELASPWYVGGVVVDEGASVHPALYHRGLFDAARRAGAVLCGDAQVEAIARDGDGAVLRTARGMVRAREIVVTTNGYTGRVTPWLARRVIPITTYIMATEELGAERVRALIPNARTVGDTKRVLS